MIREGDILICKEDFHISGTGVTWTWKKYKKYQVLERWSKWNDRYSIECDKERFKISCSLSEEEIKKHFDYLTTQRTNKINKK